MWGAAAGAACGVLRVGCCGWCCVWGAAVWGAAAGAACGVLRCGVLPCGVLRLVLRVGCCGVGSGVLRLLSAED